MFSVPFDMFVHYIAEDFVVQDTFFDEFVVAHTLGWWCKAIMIRNLPLLWVLSIGFEFCEVRSNSDTLPFRSIPLRVFFPKTFVVFLYWKSLELNKSYFFHSYCIVFSIRAYFTSWWLGFCVTTCLCGSLRNLWFWYTTYSLSESYVGFAASF